MRYEVDGTELTWIVKMFHKHWLKRKDLGVGKGNRRVACVHREGTFSVARTFCKICSQLLCVFPMCHISLCNCMSSLEKNISIKLPI